MLAGITPWPDGNDPAPVYHGCHRLSAKKASQRAGDYRAERHPRETKMQTLTESSASRPRSAATLDEGEIRRLDTRRTLPVKVQLGQEWDDGNGPSRVTSSVTGLTVKFTAGLSWLYKLLAGHPVSQQDRFRYSATAAQVQKHKAMATCWAQQPTRGFF